MLDTPFANRLRKNHRHLRKWAERQRISAFRVYDRDMPDYPFVVEWYAGHVHLVEFPRRRRAREGDEALRADVLAAVVEVLEVPAENVHTKTHLPKPWGRAQYEREAQGGALLEVAELGLRLLVNLTDYLDTGLFLDHRTTRARVRSEARGKRFLNLFCYTGAFTVHAAAGGARSTTSVDLSNTYLDWAAKNTALNGYSTPEHEFIRSDVTRWVEQSRASPQRYDLIVLDPPSFSASKKMERSFNIQRDQERLLSATLALLAPSGVIYFSTNFKGFNLEPGTLQARFEELTPKSIPEDIQQKDSHRCWRVWA